MKLFNLSSLKRLRSPKLKRTLIKRKLMYFLKLKNSLKITFMLSGLYNYVILIK